MDRFCLFLRIYLDLVFKMVLDHIRFYWIILTTPNLSNLPNLIVEFCENAMEQIEHIELLFSNNYNQLIQMDRHLNAELKSIAFMILIISLIFLIAYLILNFLKTCLIIFIFSSLIGILYANDIQLS